MVWEFALRDHKDLIMRLMGLMDLFNSRHLPSRSRCYHEDIFVVQVSRTADYTTDLVGKKIRLCGQDETMVRLSCHTSPF